MPIRPDDVRHVAALAGLALTEREIERFAGELSRIVDYADVISEADLSGVPPFVRASAGTNRLRPDAVGETLSRDDALLNAPESQDGFFRVPAFLPGD